VCLRKDGHGFWALELVVLVPGSREQEQQEGDL
jgi:hypothetical protein